MSEGSNCIEWQGKLDKYGYGRIDKRVNGKPTTFRVHRLEWEKEHGEIPANMFVLHKCDNRKCYKLEHLFLGTAGDNARDMCSKGRHRNQIKTHCKNGHEYTDTNTYIRPEGNRECRECMRQRDRVRYNKRKDKQ